MENNRELNYRVAEYQVGNTNYGAKIYMKMQLLSGQSSRKMIANMLLPNKSGNG